MARLLAPSFPHREVPPLLQLGQLVRMEEMERIFAPPGSEIVGPHPRHRSAKCGRRQDAGLQFLRLLPSERGVPKAGLGPQGNTLSWRRSPGPPPRPKSATPLDTRGRFGRMWPGGCWGRLLPGSWGSAALPSGKVGARLPIRGGPPRGPDPARTFPKSSGLRTAGCAEQMLVQGGTAVGTLDARYTPGRSLERWDPACCRWDQAPGTKRTELRQDGATPVGSL